MAPLVNLNKNIAYYRQRSGLKQEDLAELLGVDRSTYSKYETGDRPIPLKVFCKICYIYRVSADDLLEFDFVPEVSNGEKKGDSAGKA